MYFINDRFTAEDKQTIFDISYPYIKGALKVSVNGLDLSLSNYIQNDSNSIQLLKPCELGDVVQIYSTYKANNINVKVIGNNPNGSNSVFSKYGTDEKLKFNHRYNLNLSIDGEVSKTSFVSVLNPCYSTINKIRLDTGDLLDEFEDEKILTMLYLNSKECDDMTEENDDVSDKHKKLWVRYKTDMDFVHIIYLSISGKRGLAIKKLGGTIDIQRKVEIPYIKDMMGRFKEKFDKIDEAINQAEVTFTSAVRAGNNTYPITTGRIF